MKHFSLWLLIPLAALLTLLTISCPTTNNEQNPYKGLETGTFWAQNLSTQKYYKVEAVRLAKGGKCVVWAEKNAGVSVATGEAVAGEYDNHIHPVVVETFGGEDIHKIIDNGDMDHDGKLTLLLLDIRDGFKDSGAYTAGYFYNGDLFLSTPEHPSNERDMIYVDTNPSRVLSEESYATIAHELQHFINYFASKSYRRSQMDIWIDEGLSSAAEYVYLNRHNADRVAQFSSSDTVQQGNNFFVWGERPDNVLDEYSAVYLFFQWLRIQSGGRDIYKRIFNSLHSDYRAVTGSIPGVFAVALGSTSWEAILRSWLAANYINSPTGLYGYQGEFPKLRVWALGGPTHSLLPGEGVYSIVGDSPGALPSSGGSNIRYAGLYKPSDPSQPQEPAVSLDSLYPKGRLLTFNSNANNIKEKDRDWASVKETGMLANGEGESIPSSQTGRSARQAGDSWIIDARDIMGRAEHGDQ
jgi:hypothetical protein